MTAGVVVAPQLVEHLRGLSLGKPDRLVGEVASVLVPQLMLHQLVPAIETPLTVTETRDAIAMIRRGMVEEATAELRDHVLELEEEREDLQRSIARLLARQKRLLAKLPQPKSKRAKR